MFKDFGSRFLTRRHLKLILASIVVGALGGISATVFLFLINFVSDILLSYPTSIWAPLIIVMPALGGFMVAFITYKFAPESEGHGVTEVMEAIARTGGRIRARIPVVKMITSALTIGSGGSAGYEGPMVQISGGTGSIIGRLFKLDESSVKILVVCGAAAGISAIFKSPLGGVFFGLEIVYGGVEAVALVPVVLSSFISTAIAQGVLGTQPLLELRTFAFVSPYEYILFFILGLSFGLLSIFWIKIFHYVSERFKRLTVPKYLKPGIGGLMVGFIIFFFPQIIGGGYEVIDRLLIIPVTIILLLILGLLKIIGTSITLGSGGSGGAFAPMLFIGAMFGGAYGVALQWLLYGNALGPFTPLLPYIVNWINPLWRYISPALAFDPMAYALVGMAALIASAARAPLTGIVLVTEITADYNMILPLMIACITAYLISRFIMRGDLYTETLLKKGIDIVEERRADILDRVRVGDVMSKPKVVSSNMQLFQVLEMMLEHRFHGFPVMDDGTLIGVIDADTIEREVLNQHETKKVGEVVNRNIVTINPEETLHQALDRMLENKTDRLIVVDPKNPKSIIGILTRTDILQVHEIRLIMEHGVGELKEKLQKIARIDQEFREEMEI
ncbi:MAG: chloride channel protein [Candidatus Jordarchaeum sp.]|uniref:chloride channel protein n=1 Tax=Candidatus Jordarchaeum sp. TaxID=2823881 RepID=UPI004048F40E